MYIDSIITTQADLEVLGFRICNVRMNEDQEKYFLRRFKEYEGNFKGTISLLIHYY